MEKTANTAHSPCCVIGFRGHQDIGFGLKLLFKNARYKQLSTRDKRYLFTCNDVYKQGPFWWKQVCALSNIGYSRSRDGLYNRLHICAEFMANIIPIFTLTTAVTSKDVLCDCFVVLRSNTIDVYENEIIQTPVDGIHWSEIESKTCIYTNKAIFRKEMRGLAGYLISIDPNIWEQRLPNLHKTTYPICRLFNVTRIDVQNMQIFRKHPSVVLTSQTQPTRLALEQVCTHRGVNLNTLRHRLCMFCACLPEYFGGDQHSNRRVSVRHTPYHHIIIPELEEHIVWFWHRMWTTRHKRRSMDNIIVDTCGNKFDNIIVTGDIHGSIHSLVRNMHRMMKSGYMDKNFRLSNRTLWVLLGDYVDYGAYGSEVLWTVLCLHAINPSQMVVLGGNHEDIDQNEIDGRDRDSFMKEVMHVYGTRAWRRLRRRLVLLYDCIPRGFIMKYPNGKKEIHFSHGCMSPYVKEDGRHTQNQIMWSDVHQKTKNESSNRGSGITMYGTNILEKTLFCDCD